MKSITTTLPSRQSRTTVPGHDDFRSARATGDGEYIAWHAVRHTDHHVAGELDNDVLPLLGHVVVGSRRQIEHDAAIAFVIADAHRHGREAVSER